MENEKSVYDIRLEEKDKIIDFQQKLINKLIRTLIIIIGMICIVFSLFIYGYFFSDYMNFSDNSIIGNNNTNASSNALQEDSKVDIEQSNDEEN